MKHLINGIPINLRELTQYEIDALIRMTETRIAEADDDLVKLKAELVRRNNTAMQLFPN